MKAIIYCACNQAQVLCEDTCSRWRGETKPDRVCLIPSWRKTARKPSVQAAIDYADSLDW